MAAQIHTSAPVNAPPEEGFMYAEDTRAKPCMLTMRMPSTAKPRSTSMATMRSALVTGAAAALEGAMRY